MLFVSILIALIAIASIIIGLLVVIRNHRSRVNREFFIICLLAALWSIGFQAVQVIYLSPADPSRSGLLGLLNEVAYVLGLLLMLACVVFTFSFPMERKKTSLAFFTPLVLVTAFLSATPLIAGRINIENGSFVIADGSFSILYLGVMLLGIILLISNMVRDRSRLDPIQRAQQRLLVFGLGSGLAIGSMLAVVIGVILFPDSGVDQASPLAVAFFLVPTAVAVSRYKLFEFRAVLVRGLVYILTITALLLLYVSVGLGASLLFTGELQDTSLQTIVVFVLVLIVSALSFNPLKRLFDSYTTKLFFRDAYEPQGLLNDLNASLVTLIDIEEVMKKTALILQQYLRPTFVSFLVYEDSKSAFRYFSTKEISEKQRESLIRVVRKYPRKVTSVSDAEELTPELKKLSADLNIEMVAHVTSVVNASAIVGSIVFGPKKSGGLYDKQDYRVVGIIADELVIAIQNALRFEEIQKFNITLREEVKRQTGQLREANRRLQLLDQTKDDFISMASHQMRTPLTSVKGYLSMVLEGDAGKLNEKEKKLLGQAFTSAQRMVYLISDLLNVSRLKTGKFVIDSTETNLAESISGEVEQLKETAAARNLQLNYSKPENFPTLMLDDTKMRQVVMNFMDNAVHYTPSGGKIDVTLKDTGKAIEFTVVDNGIGVPKAEQHNLFSKFFRAGNAKKARPDGTGLGLYMAQKVIIAQGGSIIFHSEEGKGSTFGFRVEKSKLQVPESKKQEHSGTPPKPIAH